MTVFKGYALIAKRNMLTGIMYFAIFLFLAVAINMSSSKDVLHSFSADMVNMSVVDLDQSELSEQLMAYLKKTHNVTVEKDDKSKFQEELYYAKSEVVICIQKGFEKNALADGKAKVNMTQRPGSYSGAYLESQLNQLIGNILQYHAMGYSMKESYQKVVAQKESKVKIDDINGNGGATPEYASFFMYYPYLFLSALCSVLAIILVTFRKREVKNRMMASAVSLARQNGEAILAFLAIGIGMYIVCTLVAFGLYGNEMLKTSNLWIYIINGFVDMLTALAISFIIGLMVHKTKTVDMFVTPLSLGMSFLCGVFVPLSMLGAGMKSIARFFPMYWYEVVNNLLIDHSSITGTIKNQVIQGIGIQVLFLVALTGIGMAIAKYQQQEH